MFKANDPRVGKVLLELQNVANIRAAPGINALVFVAHRAHILVFPGEQLHQLILRTIRVLILVHKQIAVLALVPLPDFARNFKQPHSL